MSPKERWEFYQEMPEVYMAQILESAVHLVHEMGGIVWAEGNVLRVRHVTMDVPGACWGGKVVRLES